MATLGNLTDGAGSSSSSSDKGLVSRHTAASGGTLTAAHARLWIDSGATPCKFVVYADSAGAPGALLAQSDVVTLSNTAEAVVDFTFSGANQIVLANGTSYWIGVTWVDPGTQFVWYSRGATAGTVLSVNTYTPNPFGTGTAQNGPLDAWVEYFSTITGTASAPLGGLTATALGITEAFMDADLGGLTATAVGAADVLGVATANLGGLTATATAEVARSREWFLGPLGGLRPLACPEIDLSATQVRYGGMHQGLSGARTLDVTGHRSEYELELKWLDESEFYYLEAMHTRMIPGPYYLLDPMRRNRLTVQATSLVVDRAGRSGVRIPATASYSIVRDFPDAIPMPGRSVKIENWTGSFGRVEFDWDKKVPFRAGETAYGTVYLKADAAYSGVYLQLEWYDADRIPVLAANTTTFSLGTSWIRKGIGFAVPEGATCASFSVILPSASTRVYFAAPQLEPAEITDWQIGGGAPEVLIDQLPVVSPRFPLRNVTLNLLEA